MSLSPEYYNSRELSWLQFNARVLEEAADSRNPLLERLKFIAIFSSNLDEFFMVRVAGLRQLQQADSLGNDLAGYSPTELLKEICAQVSVMVKRQYRCYRRIIRPELNRAGVEILNYSQLDPRQKNEADIIFRRQVMPVLTPLAIDPSHPFPLLRNGAIEIAVRLKSYQNKKEVYSFIEVPECRPRFIRLSSPDKQVFVLIEELITGNLEHLFHGGDIIESMLFRITRDMDFSIDEEGVEDLLQYLERKLLSRRRRSPIRLELPAGRSTPLKKWLLEQFELDKEFIYEINGSLHLANFMELSSSAGRSDLLEAPWPPLPIPEFDDKVSVFETIKNKGDILCCVPFQAFDPVVRMIREAAEDPAVLAIKQTLYRVSGNSPVIHALQRAAENGKQVTVIVELKARFDEGNNILWAKKLEESGAHVVYGVPGLKIHCKTLLVIRDQGGLIQRYCHLGTGNYNDKTAKLYTDIGMFTADKAVCSDIAALFNVMTGYSAPMRQWKQVASAPFDLRQRFIALIDREAELSTKHAPGRIVAKMNSLVDPEIIEHLYLAAKAGVKIDLIVRGICCLKPVNGYRQINVRSIVDRFLEHSRIYFFGGGGEPQYFLASADLMPRNLDRRIEVLFPVEDAECRRILNDILDIQLNDRRKARIMKPDGTYQPPNWRGDGGTRSQALTYEYFKKRSESANRKNKLQMLKPLKNPKIDFHEEA
ncbi:MAG: polyphosphate kinase 1 [Victivallales bacterium]|nr:polyphosphate kinase 1 [Victivallales bacterium]